MWCSSLIAYGNNSTLWRIIRKKQLIEYTVTMYSINAFLSPDCTMNPISICCFQALDSLWNSSIVLMLTMFGILVTCRCLTLRYVYPGNFSVSLSINYWHLCSYYSDISHQYMTMIVPLKLSRHNVFQAISCWNWYVNVPHHHHHLIQHFNT
jgi:hypothetical protein